MNKIKIFLASSGELKTEREEIERFINKENNNLVDNHVFLQLVIWEDLCHSFHGDRIQDHFNEEMLQCEIVIALIFTKVGEFTKEEFDKAYESFKAKQNPKHLYVYFKKAPINTFEISESFMQVIALKKEIEKEQQFYGQFETVQDLLLKLKKQFDQIIPALISTPQNSIQNEFVNTSVSSPSYSKLEEINNYVKHTSKKEKYYDEKNNIESIEQVLKEDKTLSIVSCTGMGGVGKSTLAIEYANYALEKQIYDYAIWLGIESGIESAVKQFCIRYLIVNDDGKQEIFFYLNRFIDFVNQDHKVLLVLDNYSSSSVSKDELLEFIGRMKKQDILLTSREKTNIENQKMIEVDVFENVDDALEMFEKNSTRKYSEAEKESLKKIISRLGLLPLAIEITAIYLSNYSNISVASYYDELQRECVTTLEYVDKDDMPKLHKDNIRATLKIAAKVQQNPEMLTYLKLFSLLAAEPISEEILEFIVKELQEDFSSLRFQQTLADLKKFYYLKQEENDYSMHRLLQEVILEEYVNDIENKKELLTAIASGMFWWMKKSFEENQYGVFFNKAIIHVDHALNFCEKVHQTEKAIICFLTCKSAYILSKTSEIALAFNYIQQAISLLNQCSLPLKFEIIIRMQLADIYRARGDYPQALEEYTQLLEKTFTTYGEMSREYATIFHRFGQIYHAQGKYDLSFKELEKSINITSNIPNAKSLEMATHNEIGLIYSAQGKNDLALEKYDKAIKTYSQMYGEKNLNISSCYNNQGLVYAKQKKYDLALEAYEKSLEIKLLTIGENHPDTAITYNNIGSLYDDQQKYDLALEKYQKSLKIKQLTVGENHRYTAGTYFNMGLSFNAKGEYYKGFKAVLNALEIHMKNEINPMAHILIKSSFKQMEKNIILAQPRVNKDQKEFMRKKLHEMQNKAKERKIKLS